MEWAVPSIWSGAVSMAITPNMAIAPYRPKPIPNPKKLIQIWKTPTQMFSEIQLYNLSQVMLTTDLEIRYTCMYIQKIFKSILVRKKIKKTNTI